MFLFYTIVVTHSIDEEEIPPFCFSRFLTLSSCRANSFISFCNNRDELIRLRAIKPPRGARKDAENIPPPEETASKRNEPTLPTPHQSSESNGTEVTVAGITMEDDIKDDDSDGVVGKEEAAELDDNLSDIDDAGDTATNATELSGKVSTMFQRLLNMNVSGATQGVLLMGGAEQESNNTPTPPFRASLEQNGRMICNLPEHPIHAGATAIVAVLHERTLTVANAGDSRAVLCRGGVAIPLSFDHKPMQEKELNRITSAGGFVNTFGRVNGNLNLSRSIGDLKYKQVPNIPPAGQMITAEPDIVQYVLVACSFVFVFVMILVWTDSYRFCVLLLQSPTGTFG
jgi:hypothetical protein